MSKVSLSVYRWGGASQADVKNIIKFGRPGSPLYIWGLINNAYLRPWGVVEKDIGKLKGLGCHAKAFEFYPIRVGKFKRH